MKKKEIKLETYFEKIIYSKSFEKLLNRYANSPTRKSVIMSLLEKIGKFKFEDFKLYFIATSHIDAAWLWTAYDTKVRVWRTFEMAIKHIKKYPFYSIAITSPQYYDWIKKYDKNMWNLIKKYVEENKIDIFGGMWVEPDLNIPCGESLIRQRLYGQLFYLRNFGKMSKVEALLDVFGYSFSLPQILKKTGAEYFWTTKLTWNDYTLWPFANFIWRGIDNSDIKSHIFKFNIWSLLDLALYKKTSRKLKSDYQNLVFDSHKIIDCEYKTPINFMGNHMGPVDFSSLSELNQYFSDNYVEALGVFYGLGDGGKGPMPFEVEFIKKFIQYFGYKHVTAHQYFEILEKEAGDNLPIWNDELYLEYHRGCLTTNVKVKEKNRMAENSIIAAENISTIALMTPFLSSLMVDQYNKTNGYPYMELWDSWRKLLFNQFHDILPGSSIPEVYVLAWKELDEVINRTNIITNKILDNIRLYIKSAFKNESMKGNELLIYNPVGVENSAYINLESNSALKNVTMDKKFIKIDGIPPFGLVIIEKSELIKSSSKVELRETNQSFIMENSNLIVYISKKNGNIKGIWLKNTNRIIDENILYGTRNGFDCKDISNNLQLENFKGARLKVYQEDFTNNPYPAWNISHNYTKNPIEINFESTSIINNSSAAIIESKFKFKNSKAIIQYILYPNASMLEIKMDVELKDPKLFVKYFIPCNIQSDIITSEIQFGAIERSKNPKTKMEKAKWEISMHKWVDLSDNDYGIAILNKSRYACSYNKYGILISLARSPYYASSPYYSHIKIFKSKKVKPKFTDLMIHHFELAIYPHKGKWNQSDVVQKAIAFNNQPFVIDLNLEHSKLNNNIERINCEEIPLIIDSNTKFKVNGILLKKFDVKSLDPFIIITTIKPSEWNYKVNTMQNSINSGFFNNELFIPEDPENWCWDKKTIIIRAYECSGISRKTKIQLRNLPSSIKINSIKEVDMLEMNIFKDLEFNIITSENSILIEINCEFSKFEIKTIRISLLNSI